MARVVDFYGKLPRGMASPVSRCTRRSLSLTASIGPAEEIKATGLIGRYQARYFNGKNASAARTCLYQ